MEYQERNSWFEKLEAELQDDQKVLAALEEELEISFTFSDPDRERWFADL